jgi:hypothetical protein
VTNDAADTHGQITLRDPRRADRVLGIELAHNHIGCLPAGDPTATGSAKLIAPLARPGGGSRGRTRSHARLDITARRWRRRRRWWVAQINHPQWMGG